MSAQLRVARGRIARAGVRLAAIGAALTLGLMLLATVPAAAHDELISTDPVDRSSVETTPSTVVLTFGEPAVALGTQLVVTGPSGQVQLGAPRLVDATVSQDLQGGAPAGDYRVDWRVTSADGHPVTGRFTFTAKAAGAGQPPASAPASPAPSADPMDASRGYVAAALAAALLVIGTAVQVARRRRRSPRS